MQTMSNTSLSVANIPHSAPQWSSGGEADRLASAHSEVVAPSMRPIQPSAASVELRMEMLSRHQQRLLDQLHAQVLQGPLPWPDGLERGPISESIRLAEHIIRILPVEAAQLARVGIADDGEIILGWGTPGEGVELAVEDDGQISAVLPLPNGDCRVMEVALSDVMTSLPLSLIGAIQLLDDPAISLR